MNFSLYETITKVMQSCLVLLPTCTYPIHPTEPILPKHSEYLYLNNRKRLRIIHIQPPNIQPKRYTDSKEEYWFTRWKKPGCNSTFLPNISRKIEDLAEELVKETFAEVLRKPCMEKKPIVLLLHGIGDSADVWWNVINTFVSNGFEVVAPDLLGHGFSSVPDNANDYKFPNILQYIVMVLDHYLGCDETKTCIIVAHSYGCSLATALCQHRSQQIIQLILISGGGPTPLAPPPNENSLSDIPCFGTLIKPLLFCGVQRTILYPVRGKHFEVSSPINGIPNYILEYIANGQNWPEGDASFHRRILIPTLLVHGLQDDKVTLVQQCEMERTIPRAFLELIPNAGHMSMLEAPEYLSRMIMCFVESF